MNKPIIISGQWYLPGEPNKTLSGTLEYIPGENISLVIHGTFELFRRKGSYVPIIHGNTQKGPITLVNTFYTRESWSNSIAFSNYRPTFAYIGIHFTATEDLRLRNSLINFHGLYTYLGLSGRKFSNLNNNNNNINWTLNYVAPEPIPFNIENNLSGHIFFEGLVNTEEHSAKFEENVWIKLNFNNEIGFVEYSQTLNCLRALFTFLSNKICYPDVILLNYSSSSDNIKLYYSNIFLGKQYGKNEQEIVSFENIKNNISGLFSKWFSYYTRINSAINIRTHSFYLDNSFSDERFFDSVRALESFHRTLRNNSLFEVNEYNRLVDSVKKSVNLETKYQIWFNNRFSFGNEPPLKHRLLGLLNEIPNSISSLITDDIEWFAKIIRNTRNYYTHKSENLQKQVFNQSQQVKATKSIELLLSYFILKEIGIDEEAIEINLKNSLEKVEKCA